MAWAGMRGQISASSTTNYKEEANVSEKLIKAVAWAQAHKHREEGQGVVEYALVVGGVSIVIILALALAAGDWIDAVSSKVTTAIG
jgi:Flp pilus assembly pilin Flp